MVSECRLVDRGLNLTWRDCVPQEAWTYITGSYHVSIRVCPASSRCGLYAVQQTVKLIMHSYEKYLCLHDPLETRRCRVDTNWKLIISVHTLIHAWMMIFFSIRASGMLVLNRVHKIGCPSKPRKYMSSIGYVSFLVTLFMGIFEDRCLVSKDIRRAY